MGGSLGGAAGGTGLCLARLRLATGCAGIVGRGTSTLGGCGVSMLAGFCTLVTGGCTLGGRWSFYLTFLLCWGSISSLGVVSESQLLSMSFRDLRTRIWSPY